MTIIMIVIVMIIIIAMDNGDGDKHEILGNNSNDFLQIKISIILVIKIMQ